MRFHDPTEQAARAQRTATPVIRFLDAGTPETGANILPRSVDFAATQGQAKRRLTFLWYILDNVQRQTNLDASASLEPSSNL
jgi:hypothetical protein